MKRPTVASRKKVTAENLAHLGVERLAEILVAAAATRPELKRRLRMELAAEQGADHLSPEIDRRLGSLEASRSKVPWRQRPTFVRDLDILRVLIAERLAGLDRPAALARLWLFMDTARRIGLRVRDRDGELAAVFARAAADIGALVREMDPAQAAEALVEALVRDPAGWATWLPIVLDAAPPGLADAALRRLSARPGAVPGWMTLIRLLADAAGDVDAFASTFTAQALRTPAAAAQVAARLLAADRAEEAGRLLEATAPARTAEPDFDWESAWIDWLDRAGRGEEAQATRWASFERTLSAERARAFTRRLADFDDVEAEGRAFEHALRHPDARRALQLLMDWPALPEAARLIQARADELTPPPDLAELWAARLKPRHPAAAKALLRQAAAAAFARRDRAAGERLTQEADAIAVA